MIACCVHPDAAVDANNEWTAATIRSPSIVPVGLLTVVTPPPPLVAELTTVMPVGAGMVRSAVVLDVPALAPARPWNTFRLDAAVVDAPVDPPANPNGTMMRDAATVDVPG